MPRVLVVDDAAEARRSMKRLFKRIGADAVSVGDGAQALQLLEHNEGFDLVLVDQVMPGYSGLDVIRRTAGHLRRRMVLITAALDADLSIKARQEDVLVLQKPIGAALLKHLIDEQSSHDLDSSSDATTKRERIRGVCDRFAERFQLTRRQREILCALADGKTSSLEIAEALGCSPKTVEAHLQTIRAKTGIGTRVELAVALLHLACTGESNNSG